MWDMLSVMTVVCLGEFNGHVSFHIYGFIVFMKSMMMVHVG